MREAREEAGVTQVQLAARLGTNQPLISELENGSRARVDVPEFVKYAQAIGADAPKLLAETIKRAAQPTAGKSPPARPPARKRTKKK
jgi:transcriptional regulator with XRE-family HTH domain